jgi:hypothetical protein
LVYDGRVGSILMLDVERLLLLLLTIIDGFDEAVTTVFVI